jgi:predicted MPP superfamily phosphohydrolase
MTGPAVILLLAWIAAVLGPFVLTIIVWRLVRRNRARLALAIAMPVVLAWSLGVWAFLVEPAGLTVRHVTIESAEWRGPPLRIGLISDTHVAAPHTDPDRVHRVVATMNAERPDMVVLLGDYVGSHEPAAERSAAQRAEVFEGIAAFGALYSPLGTYGVLGNHDS